MPEPAWSRSSHLVPPVGVYEEAQDAETPRGWVEREALRLRQDSLISLLIHLNLWNKDTVHEMRQR